MQMVEFRKLIGHFASLKKPYGGGQDIPAGIGWKNSAIGLLMKESWNGLAFTCFIFCVSQHERNGREGFCTMELAKECARLRAKVVKPKPIKLEKFRKDLQQGIKDDEKKLVGLENSNRADPKARMFRRQMIERGHKVLAVLD